MPRPFFIRRRRVPVLLVALLVLASGLALDDPQPAFAASTAPRAASARGQAEDSHGAQHDSPQINWVWGLLGESDEATTVPSVWQRPKGMPVPVVAMVFNALVFFWVIAHFGRKPLAEALSKRKHDLMQGIEQAAKMQSEAARQLDEYEAKLQGIDQQIAQVRSEMRELAAAERRRITLEAEATRLRMLKDAEDLIRQEIEGARDMLRVETTRRALATAERLVAERMDAAENERLQGAYLEQLEQLVSKPLGGSV